MNASRRPGALAGTGFAVVAVLAGLGLGGCDRAYTPEDVYGYRVRREEVRFVFRPRRYPWTVFIASGDSVPIRDLRVRRVSVEIRYTDGTRERVALNDGEGGFERRVRMQRFRERTALGFVFVVNDRFFALPPRQASNRLDPAEPGAPALLRLDLPSGDS